MNDEVVMSNTDGPLLGLDVPHCMYADSHLPFSIIWGGGVIKHCSAIAFGYEQVHRLGGGITGRS
jgi:hypothetical protein